MEGLNNLVQAVMSMLLAGDHPILATLRLQFANVIACETELTGIGFFCSLQTSPEVPSLTEHQNMELQDVYAKMAGLECGAGFILFVRDGRIDTLEGFTYGEDWPNEIGEVELAYMDDPRESVDSQVRERLNNLSRP